MPSFVSFRFRWPFTGLLVLLSVGFLSQCTSFRMTDEKIAEYFAKQSVKPTFGAYQVGGRTVHYATIGADSLPTVLFVHGSPGSWDAFIGFFVDSALCSRAHLISVDRLGFGKSGLGKPERSLQRQAAALAPLLRLGHSAQRPILVGHSLGGPVVARIAMDYPTEVGGLILVAPSIDPELEKKEWYRGLGNNTGIRSVIPTELDVSNQEILPLKGELKKMLPLWKSIKVPVTVIQGEDDPLVPPANAAFAQRMLVNAPLDIQMIPDMNHFIPWRRPDLMKAAILQQLAAAQKTRQLLDR